MIQKNTLLTDPKVIVQRHDCLRWDTIHRITCIKAIMDFFLFLNHIKSINSFDKTRDATKIDVYLV